MTPPTYEDIYSNFYGENTEETPSQEVNISNDETITESTSRKTLNELQAWAESINSTDSNTQVILNRIKSLELPDDSITLKSYKDRIQGIFGLIIEIPEDELSNSFILVQRHLNNVESSYQAYLSEVDSIGRDSTERRGAIAPAEYSNETALVSSPFVESIQEAFESTENLDESEILGKIVGIDISRTIDRDSIDAHFHDLLNTRGLTEVELSELEAFINQYKENSIFYESLKRGEEFDLEEISNSLDDVAREILDSPNQSPFSVILEGDEWEFETQKEALLTIYQLKLHLEEMEPSMVPYFWESYSGMILGGVSVLGAIALAIGGPTLVYKYIKNRLNDQLGRINEGISREDIDRFTNSEGNGVLDETIKGFQEDGFSENELLNLRSLASYLRSEQAPPTEAANLELMRANSNVYRQFARFRGRIGYMVSNIYRLNRPLGEHMEKGKTTPVQESPFRPRNLVGLIVGSFNKGPDGWRMITQRQVFERYVERFREFNSMIERIDEIMTSQGITEETKGVARTDIRKLFVRDFTIPLLWPNRVHPFRSKFGEIQNILSENGVDVSGSDFNLLKRRVRGEIIPEVRDRINHIRTIIEYHPDITDATERNFIRRIDWLQHSENIGNFNDGINTLLEDSHINGLETHNDIRNLGIPEDVQISLEDLKVLKRKIPLDAPNKTNVDKYLSKTTAGHKGLIYLNVARIMKGETLLDKITLNQATSVAEGFRYTDISQIGRRLRDDYREIVLPAEDEPRQAPVESEANTREVQAEPETPQNVDISESETELRETIAAPESSIDVLHQKIDRSFERIILHDALVSGENSIMADEGLYRSLRREIISHARSTDSGINVSNAEDTILSNIKSYLTSLGEADIANSLPTQFRNIKSLDEIESIMQSTIDADTTLRSTMGTIERTPSGIFDSIFRNRSSFLRSIT